MMRNILTKYFEPTDKYNITAIEQEKAFNEIMEMPFNTGNELLIMGGIEFFAVAQRISIKFPDLEIIIIDHDSSGYVNTKNWSNIEYYTGDLERIKLYLQQKDKGCHFYLNIHKFNKEDEFTRYLLNSIYNHNIDLQINKNTFHRKIGLWVNNIIENSKYYIENRSVDELKNIYDNKPVVIVMAGPSLDKNIEQLIDLQNKCIIICCSTVLRKLNKMGVTPDICLVLDSSPAVFDLHFKDVIYQYKTVLCADPTIDNRVFKLFKNILIFNTIEMPYNRLLDFNTKKQSLYAGGTVANACFELAYFMELNPIIFIGFDLAYGDNNERHAVDTYKVDNAESNDLIQLPAWIDQSKTVTSHHVFAFYLEWLYDRTRYMTNKTLIDATEGGCNKLNMQNMFLKDVATKYFNAPINKEKFQDIAFKNINIDTDKLKFIINELKEKLLHYHALACTDNIDDIANDDTLASYFISFHLQYKDYSDFEGMLRQEIRNIIDNLDKITSL